MQTRSLETLTRILQVQSFSQAAGLQNMTLSALSMQMKALEVELDTTLFDRSFRPPRLTPLGRRIAEQAGRVLREQAQLIELCNPGDALGGQFHLGVILSASVRIMPGFLAEAERSAPGAVFQFTSGLSEGLSAKVRQGKLDAAIVTRVEPDSAGLHWDVIETEEMAVATPIGYVDTEVVELAKSLPFIHFMPSSGIGKLISRALEGFPERPVRILVLDSVEAAVECVKAQLGYTILPVPDLMRYGGAKLHIRRGGVPKMSRDLALVSRSDTQTEKWRATLVNLIKSSVSDR